MHPQEGVHDTALLPWGHTRRARGVIQRLGFPTHRLCDRYVVELMERVVEHRVVLAHRVEHGRQRLGVGDPGKEARSAHKHRDVMLGREVPRIDHGRRVGVGRLEADFTGARGPATRLFSEGG